MTSFSRIPTWRRRAGRSLATSAVLGCLLAAALLAQPGSPRAAGDRLPLASGSWWVFGGPGGERLEIRLTEESATAAGKSRVLRLDDSNGDYRLLAVAADDSITLLQLHRLGHAPARFDPPLVLAPARLAAGSRHEHRTELRTFDPSGQAEAQPGTAATQLEAGRLETVRTPAGTFADCLPVDGKLELVWGDGERQIEAFRVWLAPGVGPVRLHPAAASQPAADLRLLEARVGERSVPEEP